MNYWFWDIPGTAKWEQSTPIHWIKSSIQSSLILFQPLAFFFFFFFITIYTWFYYLKCCTLDCFHQLVFLYQILVPLLLFQQSNASCHTSQIVWLWFQKCKVGFPVLSCSPDFPDINSIVLNPYNLQQLKNTLAPDLRKSFRRLVECKSYFANI